MMRILSILVLTLLLPAAGHAGGPDARTAALIQELGLREAPQPVRASKRWKKPERIVVLLDKRRKQTRPDAIAWLKEVAGGAELVVAESDDEAALLLDDADVYLGICNETILEHSASVRWLQNYSAGVDKCVKSPLVHERDFLLTNMQRIYGPGIAEHVIGLTYMLSRKLHVFHDRQQEKKWDRKAVERTSMWELQGRTMLVVGLGGIGTQVAKRAHGLGMRVIATRNSSRKGPDYVDYVGLSDELHKLAAEADVVVNSTPLTPSTTGLFDKAFFAAMKPGAYFINVGRGQSVVTGDLVEALNAGRIGGAGLDVQDPEPLPPEHPLWSARNVVITPHISAGSDEQMQRFWLLVRENLRRYVNGERMLNVVDIKRGY
jgi:phosphoglycerate dehydrogenase-like enzyme